MKPYEVIDLKPYKQKDGRVVYTAPQPTKSVYQMIYDLGQRIIERIRNALCPPKVPKIEYQPKPLETIIETTEEKPLEKPLEETAQETTEEKKPTPETPANAPPLEERVDNIYQFPAHKRSYYNTTASYTPYNHQTAPEDMKKEMVRLYQNSLLTVEEIACYLKWRYTVKISTSTISKRARQALGVKSRREARRLALAA